MLERTIISGWSSDVMKRNWYVVHTFSNQENKVKASIEKTIETFNLRDKIFSVVVPTREVTEYKKGEKKTVRRKIFPGYVFIEMNMSSDSWYFVRKTYGVAGFVGAEAKPEPLKKHEVDRLLNGGNAKAHETYMKTTWKKGMSIQVLTGPFADFIGKILDVHPERGKLKVLLSLFDRETPVELSFQQVERI